MNLSEENKKRIESEFDFVIKNMENSENPDQMLYYFTGIHTMLQRILNFEFSNDLLFTWFVLEKSYKEILERVNAIKAGQNVIMFHEDFGPKLIEYIKELKKAFGNSEQRLAVLKKIVTLAYILSGNGNYLTKKGVINIFSDKKQLLGLDLR